MNDAIQRSTSSVKPKNPEKVTILQNLQPSREFPPGILGTVNFYSGIPGGPAFDNSHACIWTNCPSSNSSCSS